MRPVWIAAGEAVTALGDGVAALWAGVAAGRSGVAPVTAFPAAGYASAVAAVVPGLGSGLRVLALLDRLAARLGPVPPGCQLVAATTKGALEAWERLRRGDPADPALVPIPGLLGEVARRFGTAGPALNVSAACASSTVALGRAAAWIAAGRAEAVLVVAFDAVTEFVFSGFSSLKALDPGPCRPFDRDRAGLTLGEGAAALLLVSPGEAERRGLAPRGAIRGWGASNDAFHLTAPARDGAGLLTAIHQALARAGLAAEDLGAVSAHGTGTVYNDAMELAAFRALFGERRVPLHSVKGAVGHTLGAAGALEVLLALEMLRRGVVPPTVGFAHPTEGAEGRVSAASQPLTGGAILSTNSGFGGVNACLVVGGP